MDVPAGSAQVTDVPWVRCPNCGTRCLYAPSNTWRPFCSERCRSIDLGAWASERYRVSAQTGLPQDPDLSVDAP